MLNWHWLYRDFIRSCARAEQEDRWLQEIREGYLHKHASLLNMVHFAPKGYTWPEMVQRRITSLGSQRFRRLITAVGSDHTQFECKVAEIADRLLRLLGYTDVEEDIYVIVGLDLTNIYSVDVNGRRATVLCIEATDGDFHRLALLLAHEFHHWVRQRQTAHDIFTSSVGERMVTEGLASYFSHEVLPGYSISDYCYVPKATVDWVWSNRKIMDRLQGRLAEQRLIEPFFSRDPREKLAWDMPIRTGYVFGYMHVSRVIASFHSSAVEMAGVPWLDVMFLR